MLSESTENYLKTIYSLESKESVSTNLIAEHLELSPSSVSKMLKKLAELGFVDYNSHRGVMLTNLGRNESLKILRRHRLLELFLHKILGYGWDEVHEEACRLEHYISPKFEDALDNLLGHPLRDPHGDPIPGKNGEMPDFEVFPMTQFEAGSSARVFRILGNNPELLKYLDSVGLVPDAEIIIIEKAPFGGSITFELNNDRKMIGQDAAKAVLLQDTK